MTQGTHTLAANMINQLNRVDTISNNLANANTKGFKQDNLVEGSFNNYLDKTKNENKEPMAMSTVMNTIPKIDGKYIDSTLGSITQTGNKLDFALSSSEAFFKVENKNGDVLLTRDGSFKNLNGQLVTQNGNKVLDQNNEPIFIDEAEEFINNLSIVTTNYNNLDKVGDNNYLPIDQNGVNDMENPLQYVVKGSIEQSNVNGVKTMVSLIEAQRLFEQSQKAITGIDTINQKVIDSVGTVK